MEDDEEAELERLWNEVYGRPRTTADGDEDIRSLKRSKRIFTGFVRFQPLVKAQLTAIMKRDRIPSLAVLIEEMLEIYQERTGRIDRSTIPTEAEMLRRYLEERNRRDGE